MGKFIALCMIAKTQIQLSFVYRINYIFGILSSFLTVFASYCIWSSIYTNNPRSGLEFNLNQILLYSTVGVGIRITTQTGVIGYIQNMVSTGAISVELLKPISLQLRVLFRDVGIIIRRLIFEFLVIFVISILIFRIKLDDITIQNSLFFIVLIILGFIIVFFMDYMISMMSFWVTQLWGFNFAKNQILTVFSGALIPLWVYPKSLKTIIEFTPFPYIYGFPLEALIKGITLERLLEILLIDALWICSFFVIGRILWMRGSKRIFVEGG
jgi:ABC-2 type transport system permease protein